MASASARVNTSIMIKARRTELSDAQELFRFVNNSTTELFGPIPGVAKIHEIIEKSVLSITLEDDFNQKILAQACFYDYPNIYTVDSANWELWFKKHYALSKSNTLNTLFLTFFAAKSEFSIASIQEIIKSAFKAVTECHYIILCVPRNVVPDTTLSTVFQELKHTEQPDNCVLFQTKRDQHIPVLHIRNASVNDNDDLIPLFNSYTEVLKATYGDFYVAEMIEAQNDHNKCIAAEANGFAIGFMAITTDVNVELLNSCFELRPFHGLCKPHPDDELKPKSRPSIIKSDDESQHQRAFDDNTIPETMQKLSSVAIDSIDVAYDEPERYIEEPTGVSTKLSHEIPNQETKFIPKYKGALNAFAIQLFCIEEKYESRSLDFLPKAFELFPDKDYCIITLPHIVPEFSLIQNFFRITPRSSSILNQELYLFHKAGLIKEFEVRPALTKDFDGVAKLVHNIKTKNQLLEELNMYLKSRKAEYGIDLQAFVAVVFGQIVGVAILKQEEDIEYLRANYHIEDFIYYGHHKREEHGHLTRFALNPTFSYLTKHFMKEILRKSHKTCLYYPIYPAYTFPSVHEKYSLITAMNFMVPVRHRKQIQYNFEKLGNNAPSSQVLETHYNYPFPFALNHINRKLLLEPKISINVRIVVVGASDAALSFLETLTFSPHLRFNNVTLVSPKGLPGSLEYDLLRDRMISNNLNYQYEDHAILSLRSWVNIVYGKMTFIDRRKKQIVINSQKVLPYDHLILCTGLQYYNIAPMDANVYNFHTKQELKPTFDRILFDEAPSNMFIVNDEYDAENLLFYISKHNIAEKQNKIILYGHDINVYCAIETLLNLNIDGNRIVVVYPNEENLKRKFNRFNCFNNPYIQNIMSTVLSKAGINVYDSHFMKQWNSGEWEPGQAIQTITFEKLTSKDSDKAKEFVEFDCDMLLCYYMKNVDYNTFLSCNRSSLVYDGRLVIDNTFHTNDSCIRSAGTMTKFKRSYYVDEWMHSCFNSKEVGQDLAAKVLNLLDPTATYNNEENPETADPSQNKPALITLYKNAKKVYGVLPGGYHYLHVSKPGLPLSFDDERVQENFGEECITDTANGYFRLHINQYNTVQTVTCLSKNPIPVINYARLYGLHERYLSNLLLRYRDGLVKDLYDFFNDTWAVALFHDRFSDFRDEIRELLLNENNGLKSIEAFLHDQIDDDLILTKDQRGSIHDYFKSSGVKKLVELQLLKYLNYNYHQLPMYAKPDMV